MQQGKLEELMIILEFINQLGGQLQKDYESIKEYILTCS